ncbi:MAG: DEAD/DEAH box helicase [Actinomycetota bacterium]|nr:DEAD/DEAH box helicase [Actinomycetota bacterium]
MKNPPAPPPFVHQTKSINFILKNPRALDLSDPGTGKTRVQIDSFVARRNRGGKCALVIAPKSLLRSAWEDDFRKFAPKVLVSVCTAEKREAGFKRDADVYVTNTDAVRWLAKQPKAFFAKFDTLIIDEMSSFKHSTSQRSKALRNIKKYFEYRYGMTGTPNANSITDIWHQVFIIDDGQRLGNSFFQFRGSVCSPVQVGPQPNMVKWQDKPGAEIAVSGLIQDMVVRHKFEECIDIPPNHQYTLTYHLPLKQRTFYARFERDAVVAIQNTHISAINAAGVMGKLLQIASGAAYDEADKYSLIDTGRYEMAADLIEQRTDPCVVFFNWTHQRDELIKELDRRDITHCLIDGSVPDRDRKTAVDHFQAGFYRVLLAHPQSAAHGLTLVRATTTLWVSPTYNLEHFMQGNKRIYRAGQTQKTETIVLLAENTVEEKVYAKLMDKNVKQTDMLEILKSLAS